VSRLPIYRKSKTTRKKQKIRRINPGGDKGTMETIESRTLDIDNNINRLILKIKLEQKEITEKYRLISEYTNEIIRLKFIKKDVEK
jgi:archaellum component FlaC